MDKHYKNIILTNHALERMDTRTINQDHIYKVIQNPDKRSGKGSQTKFIRTISGRKYHVIATYLSDEHKWLIISAWVRGEDDQPALSTQILLLPFKIIWWLVKKIARIINIIK